MPFRSDLLWHCADLENIMKTILTWLYKPTNYLGNPITKEENGYSIQIENGKAIVEILSANGNKELDIRVAFQKIVENYFFAELLTSHKPYELSYSHMDEFNDEGKNSVIIEVETIRMSLNSHPPKITLTDKDGNVTYDSEADQTNKDILFREKLLQACKIDPYCRKLIECYRTAVTQQETELVHLYEIKDALSKHYDKNVKSALEIDKNSWSRFEMLCNNFKQGRHKGYHLNDLREATQSELTEARNIVKKWLERHFDNVLANH
jgi:hypothetical protein